MKTLHRSALRLAAWTLISAASVNAQVSSGQLASNSRGLNPAYGQVGPAGYQAPGREDHYYRPGEYLPTPSSRSGSYSPSTAPAPSVPQPPYAYPAAPAPKAPKAPPAAPTPAPAQTKAAEDLEALRRENHLLNERLRAQMAQDNRGYLSPPSTLNYVNHTVRRGDTLWGLAIKYKSSTSAIQQANNLPNGKLLRGATIRVPVQRTVAAAAPAYYTPLPPPSYETAPSANPSAPTNPKPATKSGTHLVRSGETLGILSQHYGVSLAELRSANQLRSSHWIYVGQRLVIPGRSEAEIAELSRKPIATVASSASRADHPPYTYPGKAQPQASVAAASSKPKAAPANPAPAASTTPAVKPSTSSSNRGITTHRVQDDDTLTSLAKAYKVSPTELREFNRLPSDQLPAPGKTLLVPTPAIVSL